MKQILILVLFLGSFLNGKGQQLMPSATTNTCTGTDNTKAIQMQIDNITTEKKNYKKTATLTPKLRAQLNQRALDSLNYKGVTDLQKNRLNKVIAGLESNAYSADVENAIDAEINSLEKDKDTATSDVMDKIITALNESPNFFVSGVGGVSNLESIGQSGGNFALTTRYRLGQFHKFGSKGWVDPAYLYMAFNTRTNASEDSGSLTKSFLFPDISKRDFVLGFYFSFQNPRKGWSIDPTVEFSLNRHKLVKDTLSTAVPLSFHSESALIGVKISKLLSFNISKDSSYDAGFTLFPYYSIINVQPKNFKSYNDVMSESLTSPVYLPPTMHCIGLQAGIMLSKLQLIANAKYVLNKEHTDALPDLKGFTYTISTVIAVDLLKFNLYMK